MISLETIAFEKEFLDKIWKTTQSAQSKALAPITGTNVGACAIGFLKNEPKLFQGFNIELSISYVYHAEEMAMLNCISAGLKPEIVCCTSKSKEERIAMCGNCRQKLLDANPDCKFIIFDPNGVIKITGRIDEFMKDTKSWGKLHKVGLK